MSDVLKKALKPFADKVFNDNGDITVSDTHLLTHEDFCRAYFAYRRADLPVTDAQIAARLHECVKPLEWVVSHTGYADDYHTLPTGYNIRWQGEGEYRMSFNGGFSFHGSPEAAKAAAQAHYTAQIMAALDLSALAASLQRENDTHARLVKVTAERDRQKLEAGHARYFAEKMEERYAAESARAEAAEAKLKEVEADHTRAVDAWAECLNALDEAVSHIEAAEAANLRFYRAGIEAAAEACDKERDDARAHNCNTVAAGCVWSAKAIRALPDPTDEQMDAIRKGSE